MDMKQTEATCPRRNQFTETMRQSNPRQKMRHPQGLYLETLMSFHDLVKDKNALTEAFSLSRTLRITV